MHLVLHLHVRNPLKRLLPVVLLDWHLQVLNQAGVNVRLRKQQGEELHQHPPRRNEPPLLILLNAAPTDHLFLEASAIVGGTVLLPMALALG